MGHPVYTGSGACSLRKVQGRRGTPEQEAGRQAWRGE